MKISAQIIHYAVYCWAALLTLVLPWHLSSPPSPSSSSSSYFSDSNCPIKEFHGGSPLGLAAGLGSCFCGRDSYCLCTPSLAIDAIVEKKTAITTRMKKTVGNHDYLRPKKTKRENGLEIEMFKEMSSDVEANREEDASYEEVSVLLVVRKDTGKYAIPGGFVNVGETVEGAVQREVAEETGVLLRDEDLHQFRVFSDPQRDPRRHTVSAVFRCQPKSDLRFPSEEDHKSQEKDFNDLGFPAQQVIRSGDDAKEVVLVPLRSVLKLDLAFDHKAILQSYIEEYHPSLRMDTN